MTRARDLAAFVSNADGDIKFDTDTLFIDSSANRVGIGTTSPDVPLHIDMGTDNNGLFIESSDQFANIGLVDGSGSGKIVMDSGELSFTTGGNATTSFTNSSERMRIDSSGNVGIKTTSPVAPLHVDSDNGFGNILLSRDGGAGGRRPFGIGITGSADADLTISASADTDQAGAFDSDRVEIVRFLSGGGLTFNGDTAAANALDDYEEGTWTPQVTIDASNVTTTSQDAIYTKIGRQVFLHASIVFASGSSNGLVNITGAPFNPSTSIHFRGIMANDLFDESGNYYAIITSSGTILPRVGPVNQSDGSRTLSGNDIPNNVNLNLYVGMVYTV